MAIMPDTGDFLGELRFSWDSRLLAKCNTQEVVIWRVGDQQPLARFTGHAPMAWSTDGRLIWRDLHESKLLAWREGEREPVAFFAGIPERPTVAEFDPTGSVLAIADSAEVVTFDARTGERRHTYRPDAGYGGIGALAFSHDGKRLAVAGLSLRLWDVDTTAELLTVEPRTGNNPVLLRFCDGDAQLVLTDNRWLRRWWTAAVSRR
jgi:WD40 repeat protein